MGRLEAVEPLPWSLMFRSRLVPLVLSCAACHDHLSPTEAAPAAVLVPVSSEYRGWWTELGECVAHSAPLKAQFYLVPEGEELIDPRTGQSAEGLWIGHGDGPGSGDVLVRARSRHRASLVKHEILHAILYSGDHDDPVWLLGGQCGFDGRW
jgi:hypothetical protein